MNFRQKSQDKPELNLIPMIDVLIILLIFLVLTTTFSHQAGLKINLPKAQAQSSAEQKPISIGIDVEGRMSVNQSALADADVEKLKKALLDAAGDNKDPLLIISADQKSTHQAVMKVLDAASQLGFARISFAAESPAEPNP